MSHPANGSVKLISLDWLEVFCTEDRIQEMNADYFISQGWSVTKRPYGTPQYKEMFTLNDEYNKPYLEIRRNPYSLKKDGGIFELGDCHIRLANRVCYQKKPVDKLRDFLIKYHYKYKNISRVDICSDQYEFDNGMNPQNFVNNIMMEKIWKVRQSIINAHTDDGDDTHRYLTGLIKKDEEQIELDAHGKETNLGRRWNSLKWGSSRSAITTKIYNKTLELRAESRDKLYIKDAWAKAGLCDFQKCTYEVTNRNTGEITKKSKMVIVKKGTAVQGEIPLEQVDELQIWRVEFSIRANGRTWVNKSNDNKFTITLDAIDDYFKLGWMFYTQTAWLFNFVHAAKNLNGEAERKDRCKPIKLFNTKFLENSINYQPSRQTIEDCPTRTEKIIANKLLKIYKEKRKDETRRDAQYRKACLLVAGKLLDGLHRGYYLTNDDKKLYQEMLANPDPDTKLIFDDEADTDIQIEQSRQRWMDLMAKASEEAKRYRALTNDDTLTNPNENYININNLPF